MVDREVTISASIQNKPNFIRVHALACGRSYNYVLSKTGAMCHVTVRFGNPSTEQLLKPIA